MSFQVRLTRGAEQDLMELYEFLAERDPGAARPALPALRKAFELLECFPYSCRKADGSEDGTFREMIVPFGNAGYVLLFEIEPEALVTVVAVRHQREDDFL